MPWYLGNSRGMGDGWWMDVAVVAIWSAAWTGLALWHAARREQKWWFIFFLFVHTAGILEIIYLLFVAKAFGATQKAGKKRGRLH